MRINLQRITDIMSLGRHSARRPPLLLTAALAAATITLATEYASAEELKGDQYFIGDTTIEAGDTVKGNVFIDDGSLFIFGTVKGNIFHLGGGAFDFDPGGVFVVGGTVKGSIELYEGSSTIVSGFGPDDLATVKGNITRSGETDAFVLLAVGPYALVQGNIYDDGAGFLNATILSTGTVQGNIEKTGDGDFLISGDSLLKGDLLHTGDGIIDTAGFFPTPEDEVFIQGDIEKTGTGDIYVRGNTFVQGDITHTGDGDVVVELPAQVKGDINQD